MHDVWVPMSFVFMLAQNCIIQLHDQERKFTAEWAWEVILESLESPMVIDYSTENDLNVLNTNITEKEQAVFEIDQTKQGQRLAITAATQPHNAESGQSSIFC